MRAPRFAAGTMLFSDGGTWEALRATNHMPTLTSPDWVLRANGIAEMQVAQDDDDPRFVRLHVRHTDGRVVTHGLRFPVPRDAGVFSEQRFYRAGDGVTHRGSWWIAQTDEPGIPGEGHGWRLAVRKGRDGDR